MAASSGQTLIPNNFSAEPFLCGFCAVGELEKKKTSAVDDRSPIIETDSIEQYGRRKNVRIFGVEEEPNEDVFCKVVSMAGKVGVTITANDISTSHHTPGGFRGPKLLNAMLVRRDLKHRFMKHNGNLKETSVRK